MTVSIIIPVYNVSDYIERCIKSVMNQTYSDIECIIVDDATPDDSIAKCEQMIAAYNGPILFSILHHQVNRGLSATRNTGTDAATGEFVYYLDSDDEITPGCIETLMQPMREDDAIEIVQGQHLDEIGGKEYIFHKQNSSICISNNEDVYKEYYKNQNLTSLAWNKLIRRAFVNKYKLYFKEGIIHEDVMWIFYVNKHLNKAFLYNEVTYIYHRTPNSITLKPNEKERGKSILIIQNDILNNLTPKREKVELRSCFYGFCLTYCNYLSDIPALKDTYNLYLKQARKHSCWKVYFLLAVIGIMRRIGNPLTIITHIHNIRCNIKK